MADEKPTIPDPTPEQKLLFEMSAIERQRQTYMLAVLAVISETLFANGLITQEHFKAKVAETVAKLGG